MTVIILKSFIAICFIFKEFSSSLPFGRGSRVTSQGSRVNGRGSKNPPQLFLKVVKSKFRVYSSFRCLFYLSCVVYNFYTPTVMKVILH